MKTHRFAVLPLLWLLVMGLSAGTVSAAASTGVESVANRCAAAAQEFLRSLDADARAKAAWPFEIPGRQAWSYRPGSEFREQGLAFVEMSDRQRVLAHRLMACGLSTQGYQKSAGIIRLDDLVAETIGDIVFPTSGPVEIGKEFYWLAVFGEPLTDSGPGKPWGWQLEGHHLALNFTVVDGLVAVTPTFMGADPSEVRSGPLAGWRLLDGEEIRAFDLMASLTDEQRAKAILSDEVHRGIFTGAGRGDELKEFSGLRVDSMSAPQRQLMWLLINEYVQNVDPVQADEIVGRILQDGLERLYFGWMGPVARDSAIYYRIHGPSILIEFNHGTNIRSRELEADPNHIHTIMRIPGRDFGADLLRRHYEESPDHQPSVIPE